MKPVVLRPTAETDLFAIAHYIAETDPDLAQRLVDRLRNRCLSLSTHPELGRPRPEFGDGIRGLWEKPYLALYRLTAETVEILTIVHGAMDLPSAVAARLSSDQ